MSLSLSAGCLLTRCTTPAPEPAEEEDIISSLFDSCNAPGMVAGLDPFVDSGDAASPPDHARARATTNTKELLKRVLGSNSFLSSPVSTPEEKQVLNNLIADFDALSGDPHVAAERIYPAYTKLMLSRLDCPGQLHRKVSSPFHHMTAG